MRLRKRCIQIITLLILVLPAQVRADGMALGLDEAIRLSLQKNHQVKAYQAGVRSADAVRKQARGAYGPVLSVSSNLFFWDKETTMSLGGGGGDGQLPAPATPYEQAFASMMEELSGDMVIQEKITSETTVTLAMPLNPLYQIHQGYEIGKLGVKAAKSQLTQMQQTTAQDVVAAYFRVLQAMAQEETARKSVENLTERLRTLTEFHTQGLVAKNDVLKVQVGLADVNRTLIEATSMVDLANANLAALIDVPPDTDLRLTTKPEDAPERLPGLLKDAVDEALGRRPEVKEVAYRNRQADRGHKVAIANMFPTLSLVGSYHHAEGSNMGESDSIFGGLSLEWKAWEWGQTFYGIDKARADRDRTTHMKAHVERMIRLDVQKSRIDFETALNSMKVARAAVAQAEESNDIETRNLAQGMSTASDILDSEAALARARNNYSASIYQCFIAKAAYLRALGRKIDSQTLLASID